MRFLRFFIAFLKISLKNVTKIFRVICPSHLPFTSGERLGECESLNIGSLDSEMDPIVEDENQFSKLYRTKQRHSNKASSNTLLIYFAKMANSSNKEKIDYNFLSSLICGGADVNVCDRHGQTVMHEVSSF